MLKAGLALPVTAVGLQLLGLKKWQRLLAKASRANSSETSPEMSQQVDEARRVARIVSIASRQGVYHANCLQQSLVLWWLLKRRSITSQIRFGARKDNRQFMAHAWVELKGVVLNDDANVSHRFAPFNPALVATESATIQTS